MPTGKGDEAPKKRTYTKKNTYARRRKKTKVELLEALRNNYANISDACEKCGVTRQTFYVWRDEDAEFDQAVKEINEQMVDKVESKMMREIKKGNTRLIMFYLNAKGKSRGYGATADAAGVGGGVKIVISSDEMEY